MDQRPHTYAILAAFFVTFLWSSSWVLIKFGLEDIEPMIFAGLRYFLAGLILIGYTVRRKTYRREIQQLSKRWWLKLLLYGFFFFSLTQGAQFIGLKYLPAISVSFLLNFTTVIVLFISIPVIHEYPSKTQLILVFVALLGVFLFFLPLDVMASQFFALFIVTLGVLSNAISSIFGRALNQSKSVSPVVITSISMIFGSMILVMTGFLLEGFPSLTVQVMIIILWLAVVNTALAFVIWNWSLQELKAVESSIINSTMLPQITFLAIVFLDEQLILKEWLGLICIVISAILIPFSSHVSR